MINTLLEVVSGVGMLAVTHIGFILLATWAVCIALDFVLNFVTDGDANSNTTTAVFEFLASLLGYRKNGYLRIEQWLNRTVWFAPAIVVVACVTLMLTLIYLILAGRGEQYVVKLPMYIYDMGVAASSVLGVIILTVVGMLSARAIYRVGKKIKAVSKQLTDHVNNKQIHSKED